MKDLITKFIPFALLIIACSTSSCFLNPVRPATGIHGNTWTQTYSLTISANQNAIIGGNGIGGTVAEIFGGAVGDILGGNIGASNGILNGLPGIISFTGLPSWCTATKTTSGYTLSGIAQQGTYPISINYNDNYGVQRVRKHTIVINSPFSGDASTLWSTLRNNLYPAPSAQLQISCNNFPTAVKVNNPIPQIPFVVSGGQGPYIWTCRNLPIGIIFDNGIFTGTPTTVGVHTITI